MAARVTIDKADRVVIPKPVREQRPLRKEYGIWVYRQGVAAKVDVVRLLEEVREERSRSLLR